MIIESAVRSDLPRLRRFRADASAWLASQGADDWADPFPAERVEASIAAGEVFLIREREGDDAAATVTLYANIDPERGELWTPAECMEPALYGHRITVDRQYAEWGLGSQIINWATDRAARQGARWLRLNTWTTNRELHAYYLRNGFQHVRTTPGPGQIPGWLAQRPAKRTAHDFDDRTTPVSPQA